MKIKRVKRGHKRNLKKIIISIVVVLAIIAIIYLGVSASRNIQAQRNEIIFSQGLELGYQEAIVQIVNLTTTCQTVPLYVGNYTTEIIATDCLR